MIIVTLVIVSILLSNQTLSHTENLPPRRYLQQLGLRHSCPLQFLSFSLPDKDESYVFKKENTTTNEAKIFPSTYVNIIYSLEGNNFDEIVDDSTTLDPSAIYNIRNSLCKNLNAISDACDFINFSDYQKGLISRYFRCGGVDTVLLGKCSSPKTDFSSCATVTSTIKVVHDSYTKAAVINAIVLEFSKLYMDYNTDTPFHFTYIGPYPITTRFIVIIKGVQHNDMSNINKYIYESSLLDLLNTALQNKNDPPVLINSARVLSQIYVNNIYQNKSSIMVEKVNKNTALPLLAELRIKTEILGQYNASLELEESVINAIIRNVTQGYGYEKKIIYQLQQLGKPYFDNVTQVRITDTDTDNQNSKQNDNEIRTNIYTPTLKSTATSESNIKKKKVIVGMSLVVIILFLGIIFIGSGYGYYHKNKKVMMNEVSIDQEIIRSVDDSIGNNMPVYFD